MELLQRKVSRLEERIEGMKWSVRVLTFLWALSISAVLTMAVIWGLFR